MEPRATYTVAALAADTIPPDLCPRAVKLARRIQALPDGATYGIIIVKARDQWTVTVQETGKVEVLR